MTDDWTPRPRWIGGPGDDIGFSSYVMPAPVATTPAGTDRPSEPELHWVPADDLESKLHRASSMRAKRRFLTLAWWKALLPTRPRARRLTLRDTSTSARNADGGTCETGPGE